jgi:N-acylneuraminate cytidylyltransferase
MKNLAIIPARGGSKRIPRKNILPFIGKPIIAYSIQAALDSGLFEEVMVSTDDEEIAEVAIRYGAKVPFLRSSENANDYAGIADVIVEVVQKYQSMGEDIENICCIFSTAPLISPTRIAEAYHKLIEEKYDSVCPIVAFSYPILRGLEFNEKNQLQMIWPEYLQARSQDLKPAYHDSGSFYWAKTDALIEQKTLFCKNGNAIILPETEVQDIDNETDWKLAELKYQLING